MKHDLQNRRYADEHACLRTRAAVLLDATKVTALVDQAFSDTKLFGDLETARFDRIIPSRGNRYLTVATEEPQRSDMKNQSIAILRDD